MKNNIYLIFAFISLSVIALNAQEKVVEKANKEYNEYAFVDAREAYKEVAKDGYVTPDLLQRLGDSYYYTADYVNAAKWYAQLYELQDENTNPEYLYRYALSLKSTEDYTASDVIMEEFLDSKGQDYRAKLFLNERNYLAEIEEQSGRFDLSNIGFNSKLSDFAPAFYKGELIFASNRTNGRVPKRIHDWNEQPFLDIYKVSNAEEDKGKGPQKLDKSINTKFHESTAAFTKDGMTMYFTRNNYTNKDYKEDSEGTNRLKLYRAKKTEENTWEVEELPFNSDEYSVAHPALSNDGKTLYFASDMPGGKGMSDLYKVAIEGDGFGTPVSLGDGINTEGRETFPFISPNNKIYFASDGHVGLGGLDVFVADMLDDSNFGDVYNVGRPINSEFDDFTFIVNKLGKGYFASNREGGVGDDDIYAFKSIKPLTTKSGCSQDFAGIVKDDRSEDPIADAKVYLLNAEGQVIDEAVSEFDGSFSFKDLTCSTQYSVRSQKKDYSTAEKAFATGKKNGTVERTLFMKQGNDLGPTAAPIGSDLVKVLGLNIIYFDLDKDYIRPDAQIELRKVIAVMKLYPTMKIDVRSHTDSRANDNYNMDLSNRRAQSTIDYIVNVGGISKDRITGRGYGETQLVNRCSNGVNCSETEHQLNRRSEFIIVE
ncbi:MULTISPECIES: OmpA family protein [Mesoflavibacter]|uniref:OmpA family protein n=1 Tax=Mesoflavibacter TaxID=444051 RepID=UPI000D10A405|nr:MULTISPECIES: OmpA family protein [Mesoflavibacter]QIJ88065.1 Outer membrane lipoprotein omp16 precursor [Mesoflavibacter sp. HG96]QIJ90793.1 Outer membrane lipoprotein omp16 precursor [Mesoflavibacter sp. HG37]